MAYQNIYLFSGDVVSSKAFVQHVSDFCANKDDQLVQFWQDACESVCSDVSDSEIGDTTQDINVQLDNNDINHAHGK